MEPHREVRLSDIENLRSNVAWQWLTNEWGEFLKELQEALVVHDYPEVYRTQGRVGAFLRVLTSLDELEEEIKELRSNSEELNNGSE